MSKIVVIVGPTASGKSSLALEIARKFNGAIVSADSMQIYRGLDIGTAKESLSEREKIPHYMLDIVEPNIEFSVAQYKDMADKAIESIQSLGKLPIIVGGTGLYIESLLYPFSFANANKDESIRKSLIFEFQQKGAEAIYNKLMNIDPETASNLHPNDTKRIIRALEIFYTTGKTKSESKDTCKKCAYDVIFVGLNCDREKLYDRINKRVDDMFEQGLLEEIISLEKFTNRFTWQSMQAIGYKEFLDFYKNSNDLSNENAKAKQIETLTSYIDDKSIKNCDKEKLEQIKEEIKKHSRNYAKRQLTWFRRYSDIKWFDCLSETFKAVEYIDEKLKNK